MAAYSKKMANGRPNTTMAAVGANPKTVSSTPSPLPPPSRENKEPDSQGRQQEEENAQVRGGGENKAILRETYIMAARSTTPACLCILHCTSSF